MNVSTDTFAEPEPELRRRRIAGGEARVAVFRRVGGTFHRHPMGSGVITHCDAPQEPKLSLGGGADEIELRLRPTGGGQTILELQHATTFDQHLIGGPVFDAIFCMGGGYYPRLLALHRHFGGTLPLDYDPLTVQEVPELQAAIERGSAAMATLLKADAAGASA